ncbi:MULTISPECIES: LytR/AlgR family response regulator transcription factor [Mucilaginibacter]|uniref:LytR/AlgR family response regulator transcription factor n=1 Tax=Mucilaginibacter TaxID=423349 RepID=UPI001E39ECC3|nr:MULTISPECIES: LytTR family DNA-binding domain-containing protein [Mucilaginibacter]
MQNYITIHTANEKIISLQTMKKLEEILPQPQFMRVHKSFIVALRSSASNVTRSRSAASASH